MEKPVLNDTRAPQLSASPRTPFASASRLLWFTIGSASCACLRGLTGGRSARLASRLCTGPAAITVPLAIAAELNGVHGRYGFAPSAESPVPVIIPAPPLVAPEEPAEPTADATAGADG